MRLSETVNREGEVLSILKTPQKKLMNQGEGGGEYRWIISSYYYNVLLASAALFFCVLKLDSVAEGHFSHHKLAFSYKL